MVMVIGTLRRSSWTILSVLIFAYACSGVDRLILSLLVDPIKASLHLSDTEIGLLQGLALLITYSLAGIPAGYLIDRTNRIRIVVCGIMLWSVMTGACGLAQSFWVLLLARIGSGAGESTLTPATYSLISDCFPQNRRGLAIGVYQSVSALAVGAAMMGGGTLVAYLERLGNINLKIIGTLRPWQLSFLILVIPGLLVAGIAALLVEPARTEFITRSDARPSGVLEFYASNAKTLILHHVAVGLTGSIVAGLLAWSAPFMIRVHDWNAQTVGIATGIAIGAGSVGVFVGGFMSDLLSARGAQARFYVCAAATLLGSLATVSFPFAQGLWATIALLSGALFCAGAPYGAAAAALQDLAPSHMRGIVSAVFIVSYTIISSLGPIAIGLVSDRIAGGIQFALAYVLPTAAILATVLFLRLIRPYSHSRRHASPAAT